MKARRIIFRIVIIVIIGIVLGSAVYTWNAKRVLHNEFPMPFGFGVSVVLTGSMEPTLKVNDLVFIVAADEYKEGDIVVFQKDDELVIHRIIRLDGETALTQGDNNDTDDGEIPVESIKGKLKFSIPFLGLIVRGIKSVPGVLIILVLAFFLMHRSWQKEKKADDGELDEIKDQIRKLKSEVEEGETKVDELSAEGAVRDGKMAELQAEIERIRRELGQTEESASRKAEIAAETAKEAAETATEQAAEEAAKNAEAAAKTAATVTEFAVEELHKGNNTIA